jgi:transposase
MAKSKLTTQIKKEIGNNIKLGMPLKFAAEAAGICEDTFYEWMKRGEREKKGMYSEFSEYIKQCQSVAVQLHLKIITKAASAGSWQASAWILERRHPEDFGRKDKVNLDANLNHAGKVDVSKLTDEELQQAIENELSKLIDKRNGTGEPSN